MPNLPNKLQHGDNWKSATVNAINQIIDYLKSQRIVVDNKTISASQGVNGITLTAKPQTSAKPTPTAKPTQGGTIYVDQGAAIPAIISTSVNAWGLPYRVTLCPDGYAGTSISGQYALPTAVAFADPPSNGARIIVFKSYVDAVGGDEQAQGVTE